MSRGSTQGRPGARVRGCSGELGGLLIGGSRGDERGDRTGELLPAYERAGTTMAGEDVAEGGGRDGEKAAASLMTSCSTKSV